MRTPGGTRLRPGQETQVSWQNVRYICI
jgi:hypothetical protein